jgi:hypothetical protein
VDLSICCVTKAADYALPLLNEMVDLAQELGAELVLGCDSFAAQSYAHELAERICPVRAMTVQGRFIEEMLNPVLSLCTGDYILRLDDDERVPLEMKSWLAPERIRQHDSWFFPRFHVWPTRDQVITSQPFFPDFQGRLTTKDKSFRPETLHAGQPHEAYRAPVAFEHHTFLVKTKEERRAIAAGYESVLIGKPFPVEQVDVVFPEDAKPSQIKIERLDFLDLMVRADRFTWWRQAGVALPPALEQQMVDWTKAKKVIRPRVP